MKSHFLNPPHAAKPWVYWDCMDGHFSREGITADLEAMAQGGLGGALQMSIGQHIPRGDVTFLGETWKALFRHAVEECERLGLEFATISGPGWTGTGGPWVGVEQSMLHLVCARLDISGPTTFNGLLPQPQSLGSTHGHNEHMHEALTTFYEDVALFAFPRRIAMVDDIAEKGFFARDCYTSGEGTPDHLREPATESAGTADAIACNAVIDLTDQLQSGGRLEWDVPPGEWTLLRMGTCSNGASSHPAPASGLGFESNKLDPRALDRHFACYFDQLLEAVGPRPRERRTGFTGVDFDSWEMGTQNWTEGFREAFQSRRGYDLWPYLPVYSGQVVESLEISERFLWDVRTTCQELLLENHIVHMLRLCHERGLKLMIEPYGMTPVNDLSLGALADIPMGEFWHQGYDTAYSCIEVASIGHVMGHDVVAAEAFTSSATWWTKAPGMLKNQSDWALAMGINRFVIHGFTHQPSLDQRPGLSMGGWGLNWARTQTFWPMVDGFHRYLARCSYLLQQGVAVVDILYLTPEGAPHVFRPPSSALAGGGVLPDKKGYAFDGCSPDMLEKMVVRDGGIGIPGGTFYRLLVLPRVRTMTPGLLRTILRLLTEGATVIGHPPVHSPSLSNYPGCDEEVQCLVQAIWGSEPFAAEQRVGDGRLLFDRGAEAFLDRNPEPSTNRGGESIYPDYHEAAAVLANSDIAEDCRADMPIRFIHRQCDDTEIYFVSNPLAEERATSVTFRIGDRDPELWDAVTGETFMLPCARRDGDTTTVALTLAPHQSFFVLFRRVHHVADRATDTMRMCDVPAPGNSPITLSGPWQVSFDPKWGGPETTTFDELIDWRNSGDNGIRYYSGIATYRNTIQISRDLISAVQSGGQRYYLELGRVHEIARVRLNGADLGVVWCAPWRVDVSEAVREGANVLEIEVANLWPNRLIGDAGKPEADRFTWTFRHPYKPDDPLLPSGLLGPVRLTT